MVLKVSLVPFGSLIIICSQDLNVTNKDQVLSSQRRPVPLYKCDLLCRQKQGSSGTLRPFYRVIRLLIYITMVVGTNDIFPYSMVHHRIRPLKFRVQSKNYKFVLRSVLLIYG